MPEKKTSVLILCQLFYPELISTGQTVTELAEALIDLDVAVNVWCAQPTLVDYTQKYPKKITHQGIDITRVWATQFPKKNLVGKLLNHVSFATSILIKGLFSHDKSPLLVFTNPPFLGVIAAIISKLKKRPMIYVVFDLYPDTAIACGFITKKNILGKLWRLANQYCYREAKTIVVLGRCMEEKLKDTLPKSLHKKLQVITVWGDDSHITSASPPETFTLLYSGNMGRFHDIETFAYAAKALQSTPEIHWKFVGDGHKKKWLERFIKTETLKNITIENYVPRESLPDLLNSASIGLVSLLPSQLGLSVPSKTFALMAAGIPILAVMPNKSEIARIIQENQCGLVIEPGDTDALIQAIQTVYHSPKLREEMGKNARATLEEHYTVKATAQRYRDLLMKNIGSGD